MTQTVQFSVSQDDDPVTRRAARKALSGLVALVEQRERERDEQAALAEARRQSRRMYRERAEAAEALLAGHRQALEDIERQLEYAMDGERTDAGNWVWVEAALAAARTALAASAPGTEEP